MLFVIVELTLLDYNYLANEMLEWLELLIYIISIRRIWSRLKLGKT